MLFDEDYEFVLGKGVQLADGSDVSIIACGIMVAESLKASEILAQEGISARVINMSSIKPIDKDLIVKAAAETGAIVTAEEHNILGGLGESVSRVLAKNNPAPQ